MLQSFSFLKAIKYGTFKGTIKSILHPKKAA